MNLEGCLALFVASAMPPFVAASLLGGLLVPCLSLCGMDAPAGGNKIG